MIKRDKMWCDGTGKTGYGERMMDGDGSSLNTNPEQALNALKWMFSLGGEGRRCARRIMFQVKFLKLWASSSDAAFSLRRVF